MDVLVIAPNPARAKQHEGFVQRVAAIDALLRQGFQVAYFGDISPSRRVEALRSARVVYVHSVYELQRIVAHLPNVGHKLVLDLHGVVPEEEAIKGQASRAKEVDWVETRAFEFCHRFVAVSESMVEHFKSKHISASSANWIVLPIFESEPAVRPWKKQESLVAYAGGTQAWQNVDLMVKTIEAAVPAYRFEILTPDKRAFEVLETNESVTIRTGSSETVSEVLALAELGFVLRDDHVVNRVACPTKLVQYMSHGVVPIVLSPHIGDAEKLGFAYVRLDDFVSGSPDAGWLESARETNSKVLEKMRRQVSDGSTQLTDAIADIGRQSGAREYSVSAALVNSVHQSMINNRLRFSSWLRRLSR